VRPKNDEHQGEGGTLVFVDANITIKLFYLQEAKGYKSIIIQMLIYNACPGRESNPHLSLRSALFCPLNYQGARKLYQINLHVMHHHP
jgi:hypothetical protein